MAPGGQIMLHENSQDTVAGRGCPARRRPLWHNRRDDESKTGAFDPFTIGD